jgi:hypothetical protein
MSKRMTVALVLVWAWGACRLWAEGEATIVLKIAKGVKRSVQHAVEVRTETKQGGERPDVRDAKHVADYTDEGVTEGEAGQVRRAFAKVQTQLGKDKFTQPLEGCVVLITCKGEKTDAALEKGQAKPKDLENLKAGPSDPVWYLLPKAPQLVGGTWTVDAAEVAKFRRMMVQAWSDERSAMAIAVWLQVTDKAQAAVSVSLTGTLKTLERGRATIEFVGQGNSSPKAEGGMDVSLQYAHEMKATLVFDVGQGQPVRLAWEEKIEQKPGLPPGLPPEMAAVLAGAGVTVSDKATRVYAEAK